ncbi:MAG: Gfo/Idh/MocA family oxidoreductase [Thermoflexales bacterium]|nr:Gfo/Idh/MocA family oxidoreductase [Thermoflexales bacterium]MDW8352723.1 Gfo/Idh/MocA family oxidoreductase [Anaerolineae bacterium]
MAISSTVIGIVGAGNISSTYLEADRKFKNIHITKIADIDMDRARAQAEKFGKQAVTVDELLADPEIAIVVNLTVPAAHAPVALRALEAGKHIYNEKPLATTREDARRMIALAESKGLRVGGAPDTFLGGGLQTCRKLIDEGAIGRPVVAFARMLSCGMESWHPNPEFFFKPGGGPMFDMGPYYLTALVTLLGPARRVSGMTRITHPERLITSQPFYGKKIVVEVPTLVGGLIEFSDGTIAQITTTFDVAEGYEVGLTIYGTEGTLYCPDPNTFGGPVRLKRRNDKEWHEIPIQHKWVENSRGLGVADMAAAIQEGRPHRAGAELTYHVLDLMHAFHDSAREGRHVTLESTCERPAPLPPDWP